MTNLSQKEITKDRPLSILREISYLLKLLLKLIGLYSTKIAAASVESCSDRRGNKTIAERWRRNKNVLQLGQMEDEMGKT